MSKTCRKKNVSGEDADAIVQREGPSSAIGGVKLQGEGSKRPTAKRHLKLTPDNLPERGWRLFQSSESFSDFREEASEHLHDYVWSSIYLSTMYQCVVKIC